MRTGGQILCPDCGRPMGRHRTVLRMLWIFQDGERLVILLEIEVYRCKRCRHSHRLIPGSHASPYKRYGIRVIILALLYGRMGNMAVEDSTLYRWRRWEEETVKEAAAFLARVWIILSRPPDQVPTLTDARGKPRYSFLSYMYAWVLMARRTGWNDGCLCCVYLSMTMPQTVGHE